MSLVLAADYRVPDFDRWWAQLSGDLPQLPGLGAHHIVVYRSLEDPGRVFVTIGVRERGPVDSLMRSPVILSWFDSAGVEEIPPLFVGEVVEKLDLAAGPDSASPAAPVIVASIVSVADPGRLWAGIGSAHARLGAAGVRRFWTYQALDDQTEVMILQEVASERQARRWIRYPEAEAEFMSAAGVGAHPPVFVGRLVQTFEVPAAPPGQP